ncbi:hypothetical protein BDV36DRAFT_269803 [Aspergillus pseudocaelatus]|uniref:Uncharacterized protein n=1 Tax=Aspergillus pseudocaelatus TaxID=1825620 RepID=A0ABQ6W756_9EURO|nr:hypothetical protein BDV36DRAFT_269803 [Aspergillus pseudocaelatus]
MVSRLGIYRRLHSLHIRTWIVGGTLLNNENIVVELYTAAIPAILAMPLFHYDDTMCCSAVICSGVAYNMLSYRPLFTALISTLYIAWLSFLNFALSANNSISNWSFAKWSL